MTVLVFWLDAVAQHDFPDIVVADRTIQAAVENAGHAAGGFDVGFAVADRFLDTAIPHLEP